MRLRHRWLALPLLLGVGPMSCRRSDPQPARERPALEKPPRAAPVSKRSQKPGPARAEPELDLPPPGDARTGVLTLPGVLAGLALGIDRARFRSLRPRSYQSPARSSLYHETLGANLSAHYTFDREKLYSVLLRQYGGARRADRLRRQAHRRWGKPSRIESAAIFTAPGALVRIDTALGNLILEYTATRHRTP